MGTKIYCESYFPGHLYHSMNNTNEIPTNSNWPLFYGNKSIQNGQHCNGILLGTVANSLSGYEKDALKQMMLMHEAAFKHQVSELHRLYKVQKEIMIEIKRTELYKFQVPIETPPPSSSFVYQAPCKDALMKWHKTPFPTVDSNDREVLESRPSKARKRLFDLHLPADKYIDVEEVKTIPENKISNMCPGNNKAGSENGKTLDSTVQPFDLNEPFCDDDVVTTLTTNCLQKNNNGRGQIHGAGHIEPCLNSVTTVPQDESPIHTQLLYSQSSEVGHTISQHKSNLLISPASEPSIGKGFSKSNGLFPGSSAGTKFISAPFDMKSRRDFGLNTTFSKLLSDEILKADGSCNTEGIHARGDANSLHVIHNIKSANGPTFSHNRIQDIPIPDNSCSRNIENKIGLIDINVVCEVDAELAKKENEKRTADFGGHIDLNLCASEDEITLPSCASTRLDVKIALDIDLEVPALADSEQDGSSLHKAEQPREDADRFAALAIVAITSNIVQLGENTEDLSEGSLEDALLWFSEIVSSHSETPECNSDSASNEIDEFEAMTLRLTELKEEEYMPMPLVFENLELETETTLLPSQARRGKARRGRQKRNFRRDILPGMTSLSRHEVAEDVQTFGGIMKAMGHSWPVLTKRNGGGGRGRRRLVADVAPLVEPIVICKPLIERINIVEIGLEERLLTGWGKTPRRPRRRRCQVGNLSSNALS